MPPKKGVTPPWLKPYLFTKGGGRRGGTTTKAKGNRTRRQGLASWTSSVIALLIGFSNVITRVSEAMNVGAGNKWKYFSSAMVMDYAGYDPYSQTFNAKRMIRGYAPIVAGIAFKKGTSYLVKTARVQSLIPRLG